MEYASDRLLVGGQPDVHKGFMKWSVKLSRVTATTITTHNDNHRHYCRYTRDIPSSCDCGDKITVASKVVMVGMVTGVSCSTLYSVHPDGVGWTAMMKCIQQFTDHLWHRDTINVV